MSNRPRCRDWTPLATQQLRLRNLIQISGHNIQCEPKSNVYYTLHMTSMSAPFFTSEKLESPKNAIWPEINCQSILKSTSHSVCIRVWQHHKSIDNKRTSVSSDSQLGDDTAAENLDEELFLWGVYFSGLVPISKRTDVKLKPNSLVFHIHGGFFTSTDCLLGETVPKQLEFLGLIETQTTNEHNPSCDPQLLALSSKTNKFLDNQSNKDQRPSSTSSPKFNYNINLDLFPTDIPQEQNPETLKIRYIEKKFFKSEIRISYSVDALLLLQQKQRKFRYKSENAKELMDKICMKSAFCLNLELIANRASFYRPRGNPSMGRTLNRLLFQQTEQPKPEVLLKAQEMRRKIETAKFRCRLLVQERDKARQTVRRLEKRLAEVSDENIEQESLLMASYRLLGKDKEKAIEMEQVYGRQKEMFDRIQLSLQQRRQQLCQELKEIYVIEQNDRGLFTINGAILPNAESYTDQTSPSHISVALGYTAHVIFMCSIILNCPLRNPIIYKGSASRIRDNIKILPESDREFPLYCRNCPPPEALCYAVFLLNQNIAQLKYLLGLSKADLRATLPNILQLLNGQPNDLVLSGEPDEQRPTKASISSSSTDLNVRVPVRSLQHFHEQNLLKQRFSRKTINGATMSSNGSGGGGGGVGVDQRICRSVGSYTDDEEAVIIANNPSKCTFSSEPILSVGQVQVRRFSDNGDI